MIRNPPRGDRFMDALMPYAIGSGKRPSLYSASIHRRVTQTSPWKIWTWDPKTLFHIRGDLFVNQGKLQFPFCTAGLLTKTSILLHATLLNPSYGPSGTSGLNRTDFAKIGGASFTQLAELRHRGAFTNVSQTFATCCQRCSASKDPAIRELTRGWYQEAKSTIFGSASKLTRRSAGIPAMVTGIVGSDPGTPFFKEALDELHEISYLPVEYDKERQYLELPQVHAMNCLKDIFTNNKLGPYTESFIMKALTLSADRLGSPIWALRNSGLMLFRALLTKMCRVIPGAGPGFGGASGSEPGARITFPKYPGLLELLSGLLTTTQGEAAEGTDIITERVFPALELVGDKVPSLDDSTDEMLRGLVLPHLSSPVWGVREHAARVYASLLTRQSIPEALRRLAVLPETPTENYIHGVALTVRYALRRYAATTDDFWMGECIQNDSIELKLTDC